MSDDAQRPTAIIRLSGPEAFRWPREDLDGLRDELRSETYDLVLEEPTPPEYTIHASLTAVGIFLAGVVSTKLLDAALKDAYDNAKRWLTNRFEKDEDAGAVVVTIYGPDGKPLRNVLGRPPNIIKDLDA